MNWLGGWEYLGSLVLLVIWSLAFAVAVNVGLGFETPKSLKVYSNVVGVLTVIILIVLGYLKAIGLFK